MGLLDDLVGSALGGGKGGGLQAALLQQLVSMLGKPGALANLTAAFDSNGLGNILQSWMGGGQNLPISASQIRQVLGGGMLSQLAGGAKVGEPEAADALTSLLPQVIGKLAPGGKFAEGASLGGLLGSVGKLPG